MAQIAIPNVIENNSSITAVQHRQNYAAIQTWANAEAIRRDGLTGMDLGVELTIPSAPTTDTGAANKLYVDQSIPAGVVWDYTGLTTPSALWAVPVGQLVDIATNPILYGMYGTTYGAIVGAQFRLPDMRGLFTVSKGTNPVLDTNGETGGYADTIAVAHGHDHTITASSTSSQGTHTHPTPGNGLIYWDTTYGTGQAAQKPVGPNSPFALSWTTSVAAASAGAISTTTTISGGVTPIATSGTNRNLPPYIVVTKILRLG